MFFEEKIDIFSVVVMGGNTKLSETHELSSILKSDLFSELLPSEKSSIIERTDLMRLKKGENLFHPGEKAERLYLLLEGAIRVFKTQEADGDGDIEIAHFAPGDIIGDFDFARGAGYNAYAEASENALLVMFPSLGTSMEQFAEDEPLLFPKLLFNSAAMITERIKETRRLIAESAYWTKELHRKAYEDSGTGLWKQSFLNDEINSILEDPMAIIMLKPDRFKILVDARGHIAGDEAMIKIAAILKNITRKLGRGWALRFKSNETGLLLNNCDAAMAEAFAFSLSSSIASIPSVDLGEEHFNFSGSIAWGVWPADDKSWDSLFTGVYQLLMDTWKDGGKKVVRYQQEQSP